MRRHPHDTAGRIADSFAFTNVFAIIVGIAFAVLSTGCVPGQRREVVKPQPTKVSEVEQSATESGADYLRRLASVCRDQSSKADDFKSWAELFDFGHGREQDARKAFEAFESAMSTRLPTDGMPYDAAAVRQAFAEAANGFERAATKAGAN